MAYGDAVSKPYVAGTSPTDSLSARDLGRSAVSGLTPMIQEVTHEVTGLTTLAPVKVTTAGTAVALSGSTLLVRKVTIQALPTNLGAVVVGDSSVKAAIGTQASPTRRGVALNNPGIDSYSFDYNNLATVYIDALNSGDGVAITYFT
jgi:hypothetical protein